MSIIKKRQLLTATFIIALGATVTVNWYLNKTNENNSYNYETTNYESVSGNLGDSIFVAGTVVSQAADEVIIDDITEEYFSQAKLKRSEANDEILSLIDEIIENDVVSSSDLTNLNKHFDEYKNAIKIQTDAENLIKAKTGFECLVIINGDSCQVIMQKNALNDTIILQITEIIEKNANISAENLSIIEIK